MDSRHESFKEALLNKIITLINVYIQNHTDQYIENTLLQTQIHRICQQIYQYLGMQVDVSGVLSKHNLLSVDVVLFPLIADTESNQILSDQGFKKLMEDIRQLLQDNNLSLQKNILALLDEYQ